MQLTYDGIIDILALNYIPTKRIGSSLKPEIYQISDINKTLNYIFPDNVKISVTIDDNKLKSNKKINQTLIFTKRFFCTVLGFTQSYSGPLGDLDGYIQLCQIFTKVIDLLILLVLMNLIKNAIAYKAAKLTEFENLFYIALLSINYRVIKYLRNQGLNSLER